MHEALIKNLEKTLEQIKKDMLKAHKQKENVKVQYLRQQISTTEAMIYALKHNRIAKNDADIERLDKE